MEVKPGLKIVEDRLCLRLPHLDASVWRRSARLFLDPVELRDALDDLVGDGRALRSMDVDELAPDMSHASDLTDTAGTVKFLEAGIAVRVHPALISRQMILRVLALPIGGEAVPTGGGGHLGRARGTIAK